MSSPVPCSEGSDLEGEDGHVEEHERRDLWAVAHTLVTTGREPFVGVVRQWGMSRQPPPTGSGAPPLSRAIRASGFEALFVEQYEHMVRVAFLLVGSRAEAEDVVAESFARVELRWSKLDEPAAYLRRCVVNGAVDVLRRRRLERRFALVAARLEVRAPSADEVADEMSDALATLAPRRRAAVVLRYYGGLRDHEIAAVLGVRPGTVKSLLHRALADLRRVVER